MKEVKLIKDYIKNEKIDLENIVKDYTPYIEKIISNMNTTILTEEDKEEIAADVFFIIWKNREKLIMEKPLSSYIAGILRNLVKEKLRKISNNIDISSYDNELYIFDNIEILDENIEKINTIEEMLNKMKDIDREIFKSFYYYSKSIKDIAKELKISEFNVKTRLYRIRKKIRLTM